MQTQCSREQFEFQGLGPRRVVAEFSGGDITSDAGALLLREVEGTREIISGFAECFDDHRNPKLTEHTLVELLGQRVYGIALGYEDVSDHDDLRRDPLLATLVGKLDPTGQDRRKQQDRGCPLSGKSTLNRIERTPADASAENRYAKVVYRSEKVERFFVDTFLSGYAKAPEKIVLDFDATDDPLHGTQEGRFFHGYYRHYCYLPLYVFCGDALLAAKLRSSNIDGAAGTVEELERIVAHIRERWPDVQIIVRGDSGFARDAIMSWCEANGVDFILGLAKNARLIRKIETQLEHVRRKHLVSGHAARCFRDFTYRTQKSWSRKRRVVGKAEHLAKGPNPRFVVTSLTKEAYGTRELYEKLYCARGDMENRIKEQQLGLFADRTSSHTMRANQLRLWFSSVAYVLLRELRRLGLEGTELAKAQVWTIRNKLLKIGAVVTVSVRRVFVQLSNAYPHAPLFADVWKRLLTVRE